MFEQENYYRQVRVKATGETGVVAKRNSVKGTRFQISESGDMSGTLVYFESTGELREFASDALEDSAGQEGAHEQSHREKGN